MKEQIGGCAVFSLCSADLVLILAIWSARQFSRPYPVHASMPLSRPCRCLFVKDASFLPTAQGIGVASVFRGSHNPLLHILFILMDVEARCPVWLSSSTRMNTSRRFNDSDPRALCGVRILPSAPASMNSFGIESLSNFSAALIHRQGGWAPPPNKKVTKSM
jgi:hypothetical protein